MVSTPKRKQPDNQLTDDTHICEDGEDSSPVDWAISVPYPEKTTRVVEAFGKKVVADDVESSH